jgi:hypothetical protein
MEEVLKQAIVNHPFGTFVGIGIMLLCFFAGWGIFVNLLSDGWPKFRKK